MKALLRQKWDSHFLSKCVQVIKRARLDYQPGKAGKSQASDLQGLQKPQIHCVALAILINCKFVIVPQKHNITEYRPYIIS